MADMNVIDEVQTMTDNGAGAVKSAYDEVTELTVRTIKLLMNAKQSPMLVGVPGVGKSAVVQAITDEMGYDLIELIGSQMDPTDMVGHPSGEKVMDDENGNPIHGTTYLTPKWQVEVMQKKKVVIFLDEWSNTPQAVQASMLVMLQERRFPSGEKMPDETYIIGAMNPADSAVDYSGIGAPTANRLAWIPWEPTQEGWFRGMLDAWGKEDVSKGEMKWRKLIVQFLRSNPEKLQKEDFSRDSTTRDSTGAGKLSPVEQEVRKQAWPSRRTWDRAAITLGELEMDKTVPVSSRKAMEGLLMQSLVGHNAALSFQEHLQKLVKVDPEDVIEDPSIVDWSDATPDDTTPIIRALVTMVKDQRDTISLKRFKAILHVFEYIQEEHQRGDVATFAINDLIQSAPKSNDYMEALRSTMVKYRPLIAKKKAKS